jgi:hypothetical protein
VKSKLERISVFYQAGNQRRKGVMPDLIRHPTSNTQIPAFSGMTTEEVFKRRLLIDGWLPLCPPESGRYYAA